MSMKRRSHKQPKNDEDGSDQEFQHAYDPNSQSYKYHTFNASLTCVMHNSYPCLLCRNQETRMRATRNTKVNYMEEEKPQPLHEQMEIEAPYVIYDFLAPKIECLLWKQDQTEHQEERFLVKFLGRSYLQSKWMTRKELLQIGFEVTSNVLKSTRTKMKKTIDLKIKQEDVFFNPNYLIADRVLTSTEIFTAIHHKRANDIKGKWDQSIMLICEKVLNFVKNGYPYGVLLHEPYDQELEKAAGITNRINIGQVLNKIYLGFYKNHCQFWQQIGIAINNYLLVYPEDKGDYQIVGLTIKECLIFLYEQWYELCRQRYIAIKKEMITKGLILEPMEIQTDLVKEKEIPKQQGDTSTPSQLVERVSIRSVYCSSNIFLTEKSVDSPQNKQELELLNPNNFSFQWLATSPNQISNLSNHCFKLLNQIDFKTLDLNAQVDKLYYVKWKDLSYKDATWESEKNINAPDKIQEFKLWNKIPVKQIREKIDVHNKIHKFLMDYSQVTIGNKGNSNPNINKMETKIYLLDAGQSKQPKQYGGKDIPIYKNYRMLKDFQLESLNWLIKSWHENRNTILADEMGLGKTIQTIAFIFHLHAHEGVLGPFLILAPLTTLHQWRRQIQEWTTFNCLLYYDEGTSEVRQIIQEYQFYHMHTTKSGDIIPSKIPKFQILLTNYELFINDFDILKKIPYQHIILDEAHRLKNKNTKTTITLNKLPCFRKTLLTGTPIQNNTKELWTLLNFIEPKHFNSEEDFLYKYGNLSTEQQVKEFKKMLKPYILRRVKQDVESTIPKLSQTIIDVEMSANQKTYYRGIFQKNKTAMLKSLATANFNSISTQLRKCCNHPYLISPEIETQIKVGVTNDWEDREKFIKSSGKMILLMKLLEKFKKQNKKVLIFSQFVVMLDLMKPYLEMSGYNCQILKGSLSSTQRHQAITRFNQQKTDIFLISTKAGGVGINLVAATEIIIYDSDWNPQNDIQATARAHRIGQKKEVTVYRLIIANSYESQMFQLSSKKLGLDKAIFTGDTFKSMGDFDEAEKQLTKTEIQLLLKKGIVGFLENNGGEEDFFNQSIEDILSKNARKVQYAITQNSCTFSKTKFKSEETNDINIDAPDFWQQALKGIQTPVDKLVKKRKQLKQYSTVALQQELMLETYRIVLNFVKQKTLGTGFNAEDQRNLLRFLEAINSERLFNRHFRDIADQLSIEIIKPSRRFKIKEEDIIISNNPIQEKKQHQAPPPLDKRQSTRIKRLKKNKDQNFGLDMQGQRQDEISDVSQEKQQSPSPEQEEKNTEQQKVNQQFEKLCSQCQRPKCTIFCKGVCGRSFHRKCFEQHNKGLTIKPESHDLQEFGMNYDQWKQKKVNDIKCINCKEKNYQFKCSICLQNGIYIEDETVLNNKKKRSSKAKKQESEGYQFNIYKCSAAGKCNKFYHLKCLFSNEFCGKFSDHTGKTVKDISNVSKLFRCPSHYCNSCYGIDSKSTKLKTYCCIRCCRSYHDKCQNKQQFIRLGTDHYYICAAHLNQNQSAQMIIDQIKKFKPSKRDKINVKKKTKEGKSDKKIKEKQNESTQPKIEQQDHSQQKTEQKAEKPKQKSEDASRLRRSKRFRKDQQENEPMSIEKSNQQVKYQKAQQEHEQESQKIKQQQQVDQSKLNSKHKKSKEKDQKETEKEKKQSKLKKQLQLLSSTTKSKSKSKSEVTQAIFATFKFQYTDFNLIPIDQFNFTEYKHNWCRFCGTRYAKSFEIGPWGTNKLCCHHYQQFRKGKLKLDKYKNEPKTPINKTKENELRYLNDFVKKEQITPEQAIVRLNIQLTIK